MSPWGYVYFEMAEPLVRQNHFLGKAGHFQFCRKTHMELTPFGGVQNFNLA
jgi:hypothetical protein